ncbi:MAG: nitroreductase family protein [Granulosicoccaceae bacterium]
MISQLHDRVSYPARCLAEPAPNEAQLNEILKCAMSAPDHAQMRPWRFIVIEGDARVKLGKVFIKAAQNRDQEISDEKLQSVSEKPLRSPMIITVVAKITQDHPKTPVVEQIISAGVAAQQISLGANALGFGATWLTGANTYDGTVKAALGIDAGDEIVGFIYIGTPTMSKPRRPRPDPADFVTHWNGV